MGSLGGRLERQDRSVSSRNLSRRAPQTHPASILSLHFNYAVLCSTSPLFIAREGVWEILSKETDGRAVLERARDAAFTAISAVCSVSKYLCAKDLELTPLA
jgi:hypothetical protein